MESISTFPNIFVMKHSNLCFISYLKVKKHFILTKICKGAWMLTKLRRCYEEVVVVVDTLVEVRVRLTISSIFWANNEPFFIHPS